MLFVRYRWLRAPATTFADLQASKIKVQVTLVSGPGFEPTPAPSRALARLTAKSARPPIQMTDAPETSGLPVHGKRAWRVRSEP